MPNNKSIYPRIGLEPYGDDNIEVQLIIKSVQPTLNKEGLSYTFTAQDEVSYLWAKHNLGY